MQPQTRRRLDAERAIAQHLHAFGHPSETQLGLFSQREALAFNKARLRAALSAAATATRLQQEDARADLSTADVVIEWIGERE